MMTHELLDVHTNTIDDSSSQRELLHSYTRMHTCVNPRDLPGHLQPLMEDRAEDLPCMSMKS